jgi:hypothetical protein
MAWSHSSLTSWETCPRRHYLTKITKVVKEPQTEATIHGNEVHKALEVAVRDATPLPEKYKQYVPIVEAVRKAPGVKHTEHKFGLTRNFTPTDFWAKDVWCRGVLDLRIVGKNSVTVLDWKTGKPKSDPDQLKLFAGVAFALHPSVQTVRTGYAWLAYNRLETETFHRGDEVEIWREFIPRVQRADDATVRGDHPPKPSGLCKNWCPVPKRLCEFSGKD